MKVKDAFDKIVEFVDSQGLGNIYNDLFILQMIDTLVSQHCTGEVYESFYEWFSNMKDKLGEKEIS